jgi:hypothetical protein
MLHRTTVLGVLLPTLLAGAVAFVAAGEGKGPKVWSFEKDEVGKPPAGFEFAVTAKKQPGKWEIVKDGKNLVLAQTDRCNYDKDLRTYRRPGPATPWALELPQRRRPAR